MKEVFNLYWNTETKEYVFQVNSDLLKEYNVSEDDFKNKLDYESINKLKNNIINILKDNHN